MISNHFRNVKIWNHLIDTTLQRWWFRVPGTYTNIDILCQNHQNQRGFLSEHHVMKKRMTHAELVLKRCWILRKHQQDPLNGSPCIFNSSSNLGRGPLVRSYSTFSGMDGIFCCLLRFSTGSVDPPAEALWPEVLQRILYATWRK